MLLIGVLTLFEATLTLPGIAGIILTVGMAVDANVLIYERIKEEIKNENNKILAFDSGYLKSKSTILDALTFVLYGRPFRKISKSQLVNATNEKDCLVEIEFRVNNTDWKVIRGFKPSIFKITRNGEELDQSASQLDQQKWLEKNVLKMNYKSFTQIVILGSSTFVPFMQLQSTSLSLIHI